MGLKREELEKMLKDVENKQEIIDYVMGENGKSINELRAKVEEEKTARLDAESKLNDFQTNHKDYDELKKNLETVTAENEGYKKKEKNAKYFDALKKAGMNEEFIDDNIFNKVAMDDDINKFTENAKKFLEEKPMYRSETQSKVNNSNFNGNGGKDNFWNEEHSDAEILKRLEEERNSNK